MLKFRNSKLAFCGSNINRLKQVCVHEQILLQQVELKDLHCLRILETHFEEDLFPYHLIQCRYRKHEIFVQNLLEDKEFVEVIVVSKPREFACILIAFEVNKINIFQNRFLFDPTSKNEE